jgi:hypothetical protein
MINYNWRKGSDLWQKRQFLLSSFVRSQKKITSKAYEFIDSLIVGGYSPSFDDLNEVDKEIENLYFLYLKKINYN